MLFKISASQCGQFMTNSRDKKSMGETAKTACEQWVKEQIYQRRKEIDNKYLQKGNIMEDDAIEFVGKVKGLGLLIKNEQRFENDFLMGTPDVVLPDLIIDTKCSFDCFTFPLFDEQIPTPAYFYQLQCYMELTGRKKAWLAYCLMDTPENIIQREAFFYARNNGYGEVDQELIDKFTEQMTYSEIPDKHRLKIFEVAYDADVIAVIYERVGQCREYIKTLKY